ncbi:MAG: VWA domain-containing protein [Terriglobales bacterium]
MFRGRKLLFLFLCASIAASQSQTAAPNNVDSLPTLRTGVRLVLVDVVVTDNKGESVTGLHKGDFEISEDGVPQTISNFEEHHGAPPTQVKLPPMPPHVYTNFPLTQSADSVNVLLLDALNTPTNDQSFVHSQMLKYLKTIPPNTRVAIFTLASRLRMLQGITTDSSVLLAALNSRKALPHPSPLLPSTVEKDAYQGYIAFKAENAPGPPQDQNLALAAVDPINAAKAFQADVNAFLTESRITMTLEALQQLARYLSDVPGRKNVIWFSGSFPAAIIPDPNLVDPFGDMRDFQEEMRKTSDMLAASQVAIYPIAAEGLVSDTAFQANNQEIGQRRGSSVMQDTIQQMNNDSVDRDSTHAAMEEMAKDTGGEAFYNTNGLSDALTRVVNHGSRYYSITYSPRNPAMDGKFRRIQVMLPSGKYALAYRRGYFADDLGTALATGQKPDSDPLLPLMGRNLPDYSQILYKILVQPSHPQPPADAPRAGSSTGWKGRFSRYDVDFATALEDLKFVRTPDGILHGAIEVMLVAYDPEGKPLNMSVARSEIQIPEKDYPGVQKSGLQIHKEIDVPQGDAYLRTGIYDLKSGRAGTLGVPLIVHSTPAAK